MPGIDLRGILGPIVEQVADLVFPDLVTIEEPVRTQDEYGDPATLWDTLDEHVPALIAPIGVREASVSPVPVTTDDVTILLSGDRDIRPAYRIRSEYEPPADFGEGGTRAGDRFDVIGVVRDEARVTTTVYARRVTPGTPDEGS